MRCRRARNSLYYVFQPEHDIFTFINMISLAETSTRPRHPATKTAILDKHQISLGFHWSLCKRNGAGTWYTSPWKMCAARNARPNGEKVWLGSIYSAMWPFRNRNAWCIDQNVTTLGFPFDRVECAHGIRWCTTRKWLYSIHKCCAHHANTGLENISKIAAFGYSVARNCEAITRPQQTVTNTSHPNKQQQQPATTIYTM